MYVTRVLFCELRAVQGCYKERLSKYYKNVLNSSETPRVEELFTSTGFFCTVVLRVETRAFVRVVLHDQTKDRSRLLSFQKFFSSVISGQCCRKSLKNRGNRSLEAKKRFCKKGSSHVCSSCHEEQPYQFSFFNSREPSCTILIRLYFACRPNQLRHTTYLTCIYKSKNTTSGQFPRVCHVMDEAWSRHGEKG